MPSFFNNKTAIAYRVVITSFNDDYYYGSFYREFEGGFKQHIVNFHLDLDDNDALDPNYDFPHSYLHFNPEKDHYHDRQLFIDFKLDEVERDDADIERVIERVILKWSNLIYKALKQDGKTFDLLIA